MDETQRLRQELALEREKRIKADKDLETTRQWFDLVIEAADIGLWDWNMETNECSFNPTYYTMLGYQPEEFKASLESWHKLIHPEDREKIANKTTSLIKNGDYFELELRLRNKKGEYQWILCKGKVISTNQDQTPLRVAGTNLDITQRKQTEYKLINNQRTLSTVLESMDDPILLCGGTKGIIWSNTAAKTLFEQKGEDDSICDNEALRPPCCPKGCECGTVKDVPEFDEEEVVITNSQGLRRTFWRTTKMIKTNPYIEDNLFVISFKDITERQAFQAEVTRSAQLASIGELAACIAHEINNPINGIINFAQMIKDESQELGLSTEESDTIIHEARRIAFIVKNLLNMTRSGEDRMGSVDLNRIVEESIGLIHMLLKDRNIRMTTELPENMPFVRCNRSEIKQVLLNILTNAYHALSGDEIEDKRITISTGHNPGDSKEEVVLTIKDNGDGISEKDLPHIFDPFFTTKPFGKGTGLGLHICKTIIDNHGGTIGIESQKGEGTVLKLTLPVWSEQ